MNILEPTKSTLPRGLGHCYVRENVFRSFDHLTRGSGPEWRERIIDACRDAHRPSDEGVPHNLDVRRDTYWRACDPLKNIKGKFSEATDEKVSKLAEALGWYLYHASRDEEEAGIHGITSQTRLAPKGTLSRNCDFVKDAIYCCSISTTISHCPPHEPFHVRRRQQATRLNQARL